MKTKLVEFIIITCLSIFIESSYGQANLIQNGSFESGINGLPIAAERNVDSDSYRKLSEIISSMIKPILPAAFLCCLT